MIRKRGEVVPRILFVDPMALHGGQERHILYLMKGLHDRGLTVGIAIGQGSPWEARLRQQWGSRVYVVDYGAKFSAHTLTRLSAIVTQGGYDLIHSHGGRGGIYGRRLAQRQRIPVVQTWHLNPDEWAGHRWLKRRIYRAGEQFLARHTTYYIAVSTQIQDTLRHRYGVDTARVSTILNRVPRKSLDGVRSRPMPVGRAIRLLSVGRLSEQKGFPYLLEALARLRQEGVPFLMKIAGEGELRSQLEGMAARLELSEQVEFLGYVDPIEPWYQWADIFLLPSLWEGTPLVLLEAASQHMRIVATDVGGSGEILASYPLAAMVPPRSSEALADAIQAVRRLEAAEAPSMERFFDVDAMVQEHVAVYERVLRLPSQSPEGRLDTTW